MQPTRTGPDWCARRGSGYITTGEIVWHIGKKGSGWVLRIPPGFTFESSVPRLLWWVFSPDDPDFLKAAAIHDWLIENGFRRAFADAEWHDAARSVHAPKWRRRIAYALMVARGSVLGIFD